MKSFLCLLCLSYFVLLGCQSKSSPLPTTPGAPPQTSQPDLNATGGTDAGGGGDLIKPSGADASDILRLMVQAEKLIDQHLNWLSFYPYHFSRFMGENSLQPFAERRFFLQGRFDFVIDRPCLHNNKSFTGTYDANNERICINIKAISSQVRKLANGSFIGPLGKPAEIELAALLVHEYIHGIGGNEEMAQGYQDFFLENVKKPIGEASIGSSQFDVWLALERVSRCAENTNEELEECLYLYSRLVLLSLLAPVNLTEVPDASGIPRWGTYSDRGVFVPANQLVSFSSDEIMWVMGDLFRFELAHLFYSVPMDLRSEYVSESLPTESPIDLVDAVQLLVDRQDDVNLSLLDRERLAALRILKNRNLVLLSRDQLYQEFPGDRQKFLKFLRTSQKTIEKFFKLQPPDTVLFPILDY